MSGRNPIPGSTSCPHAQTGGCNGQDGPDAGSGPHGQEWYECEECATEAFSNFADNAAALTAVAAAFVMVAGVGLTVAAGAWHFGMEVKRAISR